MRRFVQFIAAVGLALLAMGEPSFSAEFPASKPASGIAISSPSGAAAILAFNALAKLPAITISVSFGTDHGPVKASFEGPLLWTVLAHAGAIDPSRPRGAVRQIIVITGRDGYSAVLSLAEIAPAFEGKPVILAERMNGRPLGPGQLRIVVPQDRRGGRDVREVARIAVVAPHT